MKNLNISKINEGGCSNTWLLYLFFALVSSAILLIVVLFVFSGK